jgi:carboxyl-terminal processing protease
VLADTFVIIYLSVKQVIIMRKSNTTLIIITIILLVILLGYRFGPNLSQFLGISAESKNLRKFTEIVDYISAYYVDEVDWDQVMMGAIEGLLRELDPHSLYISAEDAQLNEENFQGMYQGIGIHFDIIDGYLTVIVAIPGSPSEKLGLLPGDKIISIDGESAIGITTNEVPKKLKGPKGSKVDIVVKRTGVKEELEFSIIRDEIPISTVGTYFITPDGTGYISVGRFAQITDDEVTEILHNLSEQGMKRIILDLRWNAGGLLDQAVKLSAKFLKGKKKIVYTEGRLRNFDEEFFSDTFSPEEVFDLPLIILINQGSASASEIVAGSIQDHDRGLIVGTTSFGKGLVQREYLLNDASRLRLTISKYYTPSGRLIQRPYEGKDIDQYYDVPADSLWGEPSSASDSLINRPVYYTDGRRPVYGGGGIAPDVVVKDSSMDRSPALTQKFYQKRLFFEVASPYANQHSDMKDNFNSYLESFRVPNALLDELREMAIEREINFNQLAFDQNKDYFKSRLKAEIARSLWGTERYYQVLLLYDNQYLKARELFFEIYKLLHHAGD